MVVGAPYTDNINGPNEGAVYSFTLQGETSRDDKKFLQIMGHHMNALGVALLLA